MQVNSDICEAADISFSCTTAGYNVGLHNNTKRNLKGRGEINTSMSSAFAEI